VQIATEELLERVAGHAFWVSYLQRAMNPTSRVGIHLAIFSEPYLSLVLDGNKTVESRFSRVRCAPYGEIEDGDIILIKQVAGPIRGITLAARTWCYDLLREPLAHIRSRFGTRVCAGEDFWSSQSDSLYATLIELSTTLSLGAVQCEKHDRRGWVAMRTRQLALSF